MAKSYLYIRLLLCFCYVGADIVELSEFYADTDGIQTGLPVMPARAAVVAGTDEALERLLHPANYFLNLK